MRTGTPLYRDPRNGKIAGVCAGIADYFKIETWLVRILTVTAFFLMAGPFIFVTYVAAWFILDKKPMDHLSTGSKGAQAARHRGTSNGSDGYHWRKAEGCAEQEEHKIEVKSRIWQSGEPPRQAFFDIQERFRVAELRLRKIEGYVTSKQFQINREISRL